MSTREDEIVRTAAIVREYGLDEPLAREIVMEETRRALLRSRLAWLIFVAGLGCAGWLYMDVVSNRNSAFWVLIGALTLWLVVGRYLAGPAIRKAAAEKAARLRELQS